MSTIEDDNLPTATTPSESLAYDFVGAGNTAEQVQKFAAQHIASPAHRAEFFSAAAHMFKYRNQSEQSHPLLQAAATARYEHSRAQNLADLALPTPTFKHLISHAHALASEFLDHRIKTEEIAALAEEIPAPHRPEFGKAVAHYLLERSTSENVGQFKAALPIVTDFFQSELRLSHNHLNTLASDGNDMVDRFTAAIGHVQTIIHADTFGVFQVDCPTHPLVPVDALPLLVQHQVYHDFTTSDHPFSQGLRGRPTTPMGKLLEGRQASAAFADAQDSYQKDPSVATATRLGSATTTALVLERINMEQFCSAIDATRGDSSHHFFALSEAKTFLPNSFRDPTLRTALTRRAAQAKLDMNTEAFASQASSANAQSLVYALHEATMAEAIITPRWNLTLRETALAHPELAPIVYHTAATLTQKENPDHSRTLLVKSLEAEHSLTRTALIQTPSIDTARAWLKNFALRCHHGLEGTEDIAHCVIRRPGMEGREELPPQVSSKILFAALDNPTPLSELSPRKNQSLYRELRSHAIPALYWRSDFELSDQIIAIKEVTPLASAAATLHPSSCTDLVKHALSSRLTGTIEHSTFKDILRRNNNEHFSYPTPYLSALKAARARISAFKSPRIALALGSQIRRANNRIIAYPLNASLPTTIKDLDAKLAAINGSAPTLG